MDVYSHVTGGAEPAFLLLVGGVGADHAAGSPVKTRLGRAPLPAIGLDLLTSHYFPSVFAALTSHAAGAPRLKVDEPLQYPSTLRILTSESAVAGSLMTCMGLFPSSSRFGLFPVLWFGAERPFFVPSPAIRFAERAEGVKGPKR
jgi:hypothetical protein